MYSNGTVQSLLSLLPTNSGWSSLNATGINDLGQNIGQGTYNGQQVGFLMTPMAQNVPEPSTVAIWVLLGSAATARVIARSA
jgi:hypothetical protein